MMFQWTPDMVRFMRDAAEYGDYNQALARLMAPWLTERTHVCDVGCGLGHLSLALSPYVGRVTAADASESALAVLEELCRERGVENVRPLHGDVFSLPPKMVFDSMVFCFFGDIGQILTLARRHCRGQIFIMQRNYATHRFSVGEYAVGHSFAQTQKTLERLRVDFEAKELELEFGQPFRSWEDARLFFQTYDRSGGTIPVTDDFLRQRVRETGEKAFPLYMPHKRAVGWLRFDAAGLPKLEASVEEQLGYMNEKGVSLS